LSGALSLNLSSLPGVPSHQGCGWKPHRRRRAWEWGARLGSYKIIDRQYWEMNLIKKMYTEKPLMYKDGNTYREEKQYKVFINIYV
jgi:hypothetical protein